MATFKLAPTSLTLALALAAAPLAAARANDPLTQTAPGTDAVTSPAPEARPRVKPHNRPRTTRGDAGRPGGTDLSATAIIRSLAPFADGNPGAPRAVATPSGEVQVDDERAIDLTVFFAYDSDRILPEAFAQLDVLARALQSRELAGHRFLVAGHTDAKGRAGYNLDLSRRRALAVARYLADAGIVPARLVAHGWGETRLKLPSDPLSGANRRVEVALIVPQRASTLDETGLADPRRVLHADELDDFAATPTPLR